MAKTKEEMAAYQKAYRAKKKAEKAQAPRKEGSGKTQGSRVRTKVKTKTDEDKIALQRRFIENQRTKQRVGEGSKRGAKRKEQTDAELLAAYNRRMEQAKAFNERKKAPKADFPSETEIRTELRRAEAAEKLRALDTRPAIEARRAKDKEKAEEARKQALRDKARDDYEKRADIEFAESRAKRAKAEAKAKALEEIREEKMRAKREARDKEMAEYAAKLKAEEVERQARLARLARPIEMGRIPTEGERIRAEQKKREAKSKAEYDKMMKGFFIEPANQSRLLASGGAGLIGLGGGAV